MDFDYSPKVKDLQAKLLAFMDEHIYPNEARFTAEVDANHVFDDGVRKNMLGELAHLSLHLVGDWHGVRYPVSRRTTSQRDQGGRDS